jgi:uncharacterized protein YgbK (DUF1537 family)
MSHAPSQPRPRAAVLDDDPTGTQAVAGVPVLFDWSSADAVRAAVGEARSVHFLTNSRAYPPARAYEIVRGAAQAAANALPDARVVLRGDSTLRAHLREEYEAVRDAVFPDGAPVLLLVPALPAAGRVTVGGVHYVIRGGARVPLHETEYARDATFAYRDARLLQWADDRSGGLFDRDRGRECAPDGVADALLSLVGPAVCVPDAESIADLEAIAAGLDEAEGLGAEVIVRCAPTFAGVLGGSLSHGLVEPPPAPTGVVLVCGSHVPTTTRQLRALVDAYAQSLVEVDVHVLAGDTAEREIERARREAGSRLRTHRLAIVATGRERADLSLEQGERVAVNLARVLQGLEPVPEVVAAKGGITSAVTVREGLGARSADVIGPIAEGVALWRAHVDGGRDLSYVVFPGNVGGDELLVQVVDRILAAT